jgi:peptidoglycan/LPS O-acetylase OafA/YrhL
MDTQQQSDAEIVVRESVPSSDTVRVRFGEIDGLRALAIIGVLIYEATRFASPSAHWPPVLARVFADSGQGFSLFFLLSGFLLAYPAFATKREDGATYLDLGRYLVKRLLRFYPAYLLVLALTFIVPPLAMQYGLPALATGSSGLDLRTFVQNALFLGTGLNNDGFRVLALEARWCLLFPALLLFWSRLPRVFIGVAVFAALCDLFIGAAHAAGLASLLPFMLGIAAADIRAGHLRFERLGFIVAGVAALAAIVLEPFVALLPGPSAAAGALRFDPLWSVALFGLLVGVGTSGALERVLSWRAFQLLGAASFGISLVMVPVSSFVVRQVLSTIGRPAAAANAAIVSILAGLVVWQLADRWFAAGDLRRNIAEFVGPWLDSLLRLARADRITLGALAIRVPEPTTHAEVDATFYAPPPRPASGDLAVVSMRSGSPEDLAAEIMEMKKRLSDRSTEIFAEAAPPEPEPEPVPVEPEEPYAKPGFYRRPPAPVPGAQTAPAAQANPAMQTPQQAPQPQPAAPVPPAPRVASNSETPLHAYVEPQPISLSFDGASNIEAAATTPQAAPQYEHFTFESPARASSSEQAQPPQPQIPALPAAPTSRGPIKMRLGPIGNPTPSVNGNGKHHKVNGLDD